MGIKKSMAKFGSRFMFEYSLEMMRPQIIAGLRKFLSPISSDDMAGMVEEVRFPSMEGVNFAAIGDNIEYMKAITPLRLLELLADTRPDLVKVIQDCGKSGAEYIVQLRLHLLENIKHPEKELSESTDYGQVEEKMVKASCDQCGKSFAIPETKASSTVECPFCQAGEETKEESPEESGEESQ